MYPGGPPIYVLRELFDREHRRGPRQTADVSVYRHFASRHEELISVPEVAKSDELAVSRRGVGNQAYAKGQYELALLMYNHSICYAETRSEQLGIGYANRSAVYYELGEYEFALYNIDLAKRHRYPERLMPKLQTRETNCKDRIAAGLSKGTVPHSMVNMNVEVNPRIPFLAKGIDIKQYPGMGRGLEAKRNFDSGDVILKEDVDLCFVSFQKSYSHCAHCGSQFLKSLLPCPGCVIFMYCCEECREKDYRNIHRFECSVITKLSGVTDASALIMARLFFYGLTTFNDDINRMMKYGLSTAGAGCNPLDYCFINPNSHSMYKILHKATPNQRLHPSGEHKLKLNAAVYYQVFMKNPLVQAIFHNEAQRNFMLRCMVNHGRTGLFLTVDQEDAGQKVLVSMSPIATLINHSCDPNAIAVVDSGRIKIVVLRPIRTSEQITISYGSTTWWSKDWPRSKLAFRCKCVVCDYGPAGDKWRAAHQLARPISIETTCPADGAESELVNYQRRVKKLARSGLHPGAEFGQTIKMYGELLVEAVLRENAKLNRAKVV